MRYPGITMDEGGRALECPVCKNSDLHDEGFYCIICGFRLKNICMTVKGGAAKEVAAGELAYEVCKSYDPLPGNARFCPDCGEKTTFFDEGYLRPWKQYLDNLLRISDAG